MYAQTKHPTKSFFVCMQNRYSGLTPTGCGERDFPYNASK